jgi:hypothetical protein
VKFGGGFYCGLLEVAGKDPIYVINGFFMTMRAEYTKVRRGARRQHVTAFGPW